MKKKKPVFGDLSDPRGMARKREEFFEWLRSMNYSKQTMCSWWYSLNRFIRWAEERGITKPAEVTKAIMERYQRHLYHSRKENGQPLSFRSQELYLSALRAFFRHLARGNQILYNPVADILPPRSARRLPKHILTLPDVEAVLNQPDVSYTIGLRDKAILETFYSTGMRRVELAHLNVFDLDVERGTVMIRQGKGKKDRLIPIGERAVLWLEKYLYSARPSLAKEPDDGTLFLTRDGTIFCLARLTSLVGMYVKAADIGKSGSCHLFRHTMATLMLDNGADIRFIQEMLGHQSMATTQIYTKVSIQKLKEIHTSKHPGAKLFKDDPVQEHQAEERPFEEQTQERDKRLCELAEDPADKSEEP